MLSFTCFKTFWGQYLNYVRECGLQKRLLHGEQPFLDEPIRNKIVREQALSAGGLTQFVIEKCHNVIKWILEAIFKNGDAVDAAGRAIPRPQWPSSAEDQGRVKSAAEEGATFVNSLTSLVNMVSLLIDPSSEGLLSHWACEQLLSGWHQWQHDDLSRVRKVMNTIEV